MSSGIIDTGNINIWYETFGSPENEPILLIMGAGSQGILWTDDFCTHLSNYQYYVIRYDHRDTGLSTCRNYDEYPYLLNDLANDALNLLNKLNISKAHVVGLSMGGYIVQLLAINHSERLLTASIIMSTPSHMVVMNALAGTSTTNDLLPMPRKEVVEFFSKPPHDLSDKDETIEYSLKTWELLNGSTASFDKDYWRMLVTKHYNRIKDHYAQYNHGRACLASPEDRTHLLKQVRTPTLIIHGSKDPMIPAEHGKALARIISNSKLIIVEGMGHALNPTFQKEIISAIINHIQTKGIRKNRL
jgi:pimeloyl-ACP methyl ester carboxylesterase